MEKENLLEEQNQKELYPERYDESLFKRAYSAGIKLMELEKKEKRKKNILYILSFILLVGLISLGIYLFVSYKPSVYTEPVVWIKEQENILLNDPYEDYVSEEITADITAKSAIAFDPDTGEVFFEKDVNTKRLIASITKLVSSMVIIDTMNLSDIVTVGVLPTYGEEELYGMGLEEGDQVTVENLLKMMLVSSYNDAAIAASEKMGGEEFISLMNEKVSSLGLENTHFANPCGLDDVNNYSTAFDLYKIIRAFVHYTTLMNMVDNKSVEVEYVRDGETVKETIKSTNYLMGRENVVGLKTGYTEDAGASVITMYKFDNEKKLVIVIIDSQDRYTETEIIEKLIEGI